MIAGIVFMWRWFVVQRQDKNKKLFLSYRAGQYEIEGDKKAFYGYRNVDVGGLWIEWAWDGRHLIIRNDRYGFQPYYYFQTRDSFGISSSIVDLLGWGASTKIDDVAMAVFIRLGYFFGNDTPFEAIRALPPGFIADHSVQLKV